MPKQKKPTFKSDHTRFFRLAPETELADLLIQFGLQDMVTPGAKDEIRVMTNKTFEIVSAALTELMPDQMPPVDKALNKSARKEYPALQNLFDLKQKNPVFKKYLDEVFPARDLDHKTKQHYALALMLLTDDILPPHVIETPVVVFNDEKKKELSQPDLEKLLKRYLLGVMHFHRKSPKDEGFNAARQEKIDEIGTHTWSPNLKAILEQIRLHYGIETGVSVKTENGFRLLKELGLKDLFLFRKEATTGCAEATAAREAVRLIFEKTAGTFCPSFFNEPIKLGDEIKTMLFMGVKADGTTVPIALNLPADKELPRYGDGNSGGVNLEELLRQLHIEKALGGPGHSEIISLQYDRAGEKGRLDPIGVAAAALDYTKLVDGKPTEGEFIVLFDKTYRSHLHKKGNANLGCNTISYHLPKVSELVEKMQERFPGKVHFADIAWRAKIIEAKPEHIESVVAGAALGSRKRAVSM